MQRDVIYIYIYAVMNIQTGEKVIEEFRGQRQSDGYTYIMAVASCAIQYGGWFVAPVSENVNYPPLRA